MTVASSPSRRLGLCVIGGAVFGPVVIAAISPLQAGRGVPCIIGGLAGLIALAMLFLQPLLAAGWLPGVGILRARCWHLWLGRGLTVAVRLHGAGLNLASPPDMLDALLLVAPTPFSVCGVIGLWATRVAALLVAVRVLIGFCPATWRTVHNLLAVVVVVASVFHALMIDGAMGRVSKWLLCIAVLVATACVTWQRRVMRSTGMRRRSVGSLDITEQNTMSSLSFYGAAGTVTGSCTMLDTGVVQCLVDCGLFQGNRRVAALNEEPFPFEASSVDFLLLTHAHTDHAGLIPKLIKAGFSGPIYATQATADLLEFMMEDSARIQQSNTERENRRRQRRGKPVIESLFTLEHAYEALKRMRSVAYGEWFEPGRGLGARYWNAGHILGSASIEVRYADPSGGNTLRLLFSGDLGPDEKTFHAEPDAEQGFDYVICESTYGDRERAAYTLVERRAALKKELVEGLARGGNIIIPSFAVERSQELLHDIGVLLANDELPEATVYLDSPLASKVTEVFVQHAETLQDIDLPAEQLFRHPRFRIVQSVEDSKAIAGVTSGAIIVSASGMADAGRVVHHLKNNIWRKEATVLFVGYQSPGTTGAHIRSGADAVFLHGKEFRIAATVRSIGNYSAHADQGELLDWIVERGPIVGALFLNHGDDDARRGLTELLVERGIDRSRIVHPVFDERFELGAGTSESKGRVTTRIDPDALQNDENEAHERFVLALSRRLDELDDRDKGRALLERLASVLDNPG